MAREVTGTVECYFESEAFWAAHGHEQLDLGVRWMRDACERLRHEVGPLVVTHDGERIVVLADDGAWALIDPLVVALAQWSSEGGVELLCAVFWQLGRL